MGFTKLDNSYLDSPNNLNHTEFRVRMAIERLTGGFHRKSYKIPYSQITDMTGVKNVYLVMKSLKKKGEISFESESGRASVITILNPTKSFRGSSKQPTKSFSTPLSKNDTDHINNLYDPQRAIEKIKENLKKDLFLEFKNKYPEDKFDDDTVFDVWKSLNDADKQLAAGVMEYQNNRWAEIDHKYIPKASNYLLKRQFLDDAVRKAYESKIRREKDKIKQREYYEKADQNAATDEEKRKILNQFKDARE